MSSPITNTEEQYYTTGQVARVLRVSVSTIKRWIKDDPSLSPKYENASGWRLFKESDVQIFRNIMRNRKKFGRIFKPQTLKPVDN